MKNVRIIKVGGSLFQQKDFPARLRAWIANQTRSRTVLIAGGGSLVEAIRDADQRFGLSDHASHWLAIRAMRVTARLLAELLSCPVIDEIEERQTTSLSVLDAWDFLQAGATSNSPLPASWDVTSDSIAAKVAIAQEAELVLIKSRPVADIQEAIEKGVVDRHFSLLVDLLPSVRFASFEEQPSKPKT